MAVLENSQQRMLEYFAKYVLALADDMIPYLSLTEQVTLYMQM